MKIERINPIDYPGWDELLLNNDQTTFFHTSSWAKVLHESYNYKPLYFTIINDYKLSSLIPVMEIKSFLTGNRGVSLPFSDFCPFIFSGTNNSKEIIDYLIQYGRKSGWKYLEWRGQDKRGVFSNIKPYSHYYAHTLDISQNEECIFKKFKGSVRTHIRKAIKENVKVSITNSTKSLKEFYRLNFMSRKYHGLPPQPLKFFKKIHQHILSEKKGILLLATHQKRPIAAAIYFHYGNQAIYKYSAFDRRYRNLRPVNLVIWEAIKYHIQNSYKSVSLGRTQLNHKGLLDFKRAWRGKEEIINYYKYNLTKDFFIEEKSGNKTPPYSIFKILPSPLARVTGNILYRHVG